MRATGSALPYVRYKTFQAVCTPFCAGLPSFHSCPLEIRCDEQMLAADVLPASTLQHVKFTGLCSTYIAYSFQTFRISCTDCSVCWSFSINCCTVFLTIDLQIVNFLHCFTPGTKALYRN